MIAAIAGIASAAMPNLLKSPSPRYMGGPLVSTVNTSLSNVAGGSLQELINIDSSRRNASDRAAWQSVWVNEVPKQPLSVAQVTLINKLDPTLPVSSRAGGFPIVNANGDLIDFRVPSPTATSDTVDAIRGLLGLPPQSGGSSLATPDSEYVPVLGARMAKSTLVIGGLAVAAVIAAILITRRR